MTETLEATTQTLLFDAFISYSRKDGEFAERLENALERYRPPKGLGLSRRRLRVFRDVGDLTGSDYGKAIEGYLAQSKTLIVVCSPDARASEWVNDEVRRFAAVRGADQIIPILVRGRPNNEVGNTPEAAFPDALLELVDIPLATSYLGREPRQSVRRGRFGNAWHTLLATILGVQREALEERDRKRRAATLRLVGSGVIVIMAALMGLTRWALLERRAALDQTTLAQANELAALSTLALDRDDDHTRGFHFAAASLTLDPSNPTARALMFRSLYEGRLYRFRGRPRAKPFYRVVPIQIAERKESELFDDFAFEVGFHPTIAFWRGTSANGFYTGVQDLDRGEFIVRGVDGVETGSIPGTWPVAAFTKGGRYLATGSTQGEVRLTEVVPDRFTGAGRLHEWTSLGGLDGMVDRLWFSNEGTTLFSSIGFGAPALAWRLDGHELPVVPIQIPGGAPVFVDSLGSRVIVAGSDVQFWDGSSGLRTVSASLSTVAGDGQRVLLADGPRLRFLDGTGREVAVADPGAPVRSMIPLTGGGGFATLGGDHLVLWDAEGMEMARLAPSAVGGTIVGASRDQAVVSLGDATLLLSWNGGARRVLQGRVDAGGVADDGRRAALILPPDTVAVLDVESGVITDRVSLTDLMRPRNDSYQHQDGISGIPELARITADGGVIYAVEGADRFLMVWDVDRGRARLSDSRPGAALDMVDGDGFMALFSDETGAIGFLDADGELVFTTSDLNPGGFLFDDFSAGRWVAGGRFLAVDYRTGPNPTDPQGGSLLLPFSPSFWIEAARATGDTLALADRQRAYTSVSESDALAPGAPPFSGTISACMPDTYDSRGFVRCMLEVVSLAALEQAAGVPAFVGGPHVNGALDFSANEPGQYNPAFVEWVRRTFVPDSGGAAARALTSQLYSQGLGDRARIHYAALHALDRDPALKGRIMAGYSARFTGDGDPITYLYSEIHPITEEVEARFDYPEWEVVGALGFWIRRELDGTRGEFEAALGALLEAHDPEFLASARPDGILWLDPFLPPWERELRDKEMWDRARAADPCGWEQSRDALKGVRTLYCTMGRAGLVEELLGEIDIPVFTSGPHADSQLDLGADDFGHYNPEFVRWLAVRLIPGPDQPRARRAGGAFYWAFRDVARWYYRTLVHLRQNPELESALVGAYAQHPDPMRLVRESLSLWLDEAGGEADDGRSGTLAAVATGFWIRRELDGSRPEFESALNELLIAFDSDFVLSMEANEP